MQNVINRKADVSTELANFMKKKGIKTTDLANLLGYTQPWVSKLRSGKMKLDFNQVKRLLENLPEDSEDLQLEIAHQMFAIIPPLADGVKTYHQDALHLGTRSIAELDQATKALTNSIDEFNDGAEADTRDPLEAVNQLADAIFIGLNAEIDICHEYGFSMADLINEREKLWRMKGLVR